MNWCKNLDRMVQLYIHSKNSDQYTALSDG